jgi:hypothetical protein
MITEYVPDNTPVPDILARHAGFDSPEVRTVVTRQTGGKVFWHMSGPWWLILLMLCCAAFGFGAIIGLVLRAFL